ncbi:MAG: DUF1549 domain-containing protein, partial [Planctomycetes bacterium]|nr:DUF1549 domain-containing protein [Planctomycetota bacterium]
MLNVQNHLSGLERPSWWTISAVFVSVASISVAPASVGFASGTIAPELPPAAERKVNFKSDVAPILSRSCHSCHGAQKEESGLRLDVRQRALDGGDSGTTILPGNSAGSVLIHRVAGLNDAWMPPPGKGKPLTPAEIGILRAWIDQGAVWPDAYAGGDNTRGKNHWAFQPIRRSTPPPLRDTAWPRNDIDRFVLAKLEQNDVRPSPEADRLTLLRRIHLDLIGLPPSAAEVRAFRNDDGPDAYERVVNRLLASPHYGERWGRYWLDMARYADSDGYEKDNERPHAWRWRDWVIDALNRDLPFDVFSTEQIAGDLLPNASLNQHVATGFHRNTLLNTEGGVDGEEDRVKRTVDRTNTVGEVWLGLTIECGQCHSH